MYVSAGDAQALAFLTAALAQPTRLAAEGARLTYQWDTRLSEWWHNA